MPFLDAETAPFRVICAPWGREKCGKTHVALTFPDPIYYINFDMGLEGVIDKFVTNKDIKVSTIKCGLMKGIGNGEALAEFERDYALALVEASKAAGTVVVDTFTQVRQLVDAVKLDEVRARRSKKKGIPEEDVQVLSLDYAESNLAIGSYIRQAWALPAVNLVLIHRAAKVYDSQGRETNEVKLQGWGEVPAAVGVTFQMQHETDGKFTATIDSCRANYKLRNFKIPEPSYEMLAALLKG